MELGAGRCSAGAFDGVRPGLRSTGEVGRVVVTKTESKGKGNKRIRLEIVDA